VFEPIEPIDGNLSVMIAGKRSARPILIMSMVAPGKPAKDKIQKIFALKDGDETYRIGVINRGKDLWIHQKSNYFRLSFKAN
jgi:hypothetical protein